jgi:hypothetical protein
MSYKYTSRNLLDEPHNYMYSEFKGEDFLSEYLENRINFLWNLAPNDHNEFTGLDKHVLNQAYNILTPKKNANLLRIPEAFIPKSYSNLPTLQKIVSPHSFTIKEKIETFELLEAILQNYLLERSLSHDVWLNRIVQRFEVTKKLGKYYLPGFRKSEGGYDDIRLYQVLSIILAFSYSQSKELQHLSTLLKVNDLLLSLPRALLNFEGNILSWNVGVVLEINAVSSFLES